MWAENAYLTVGAKPGETSKPGLSRCPPWPIRCSFHPSANRSSPWTISGEVDFQERENNQPWITHRIKKGSFFLTSGGAPYDCRWRAVTSEPFEAMTVFVELPLLQRALEEVFGADAAYAQLRDVSAFTDVVLDSLMERLRDELIQRQASPLFVQGIAQAIAIHLARNYTVNTHRPPVPGNRAGTSARR
jgi:AraC family transcriptional regulator